MIGKTNVSCRINSNFLWISWCLYKNSESKYPNEIISRKLRGKKHPRNADCLFGKGFCGLPLNHPRGRGMFEGSASVWPCDKSLMRSEEKEMPKPSGNIPQQRQGMLHFSSSPELSLCCGLSLSPCDWQ